MSTLEISLPDPLRKFVDARVSLGRYPSAGDFVRELVQSAESVSRKSVCRGQTTPGRGLYRGCKTPGKGEATPSALADPEGAGVRSVWPIFLLPVRAFLLPVRAFLLPVWACLVLCRGFYTPGTSPCRGFYTPGISHEQGRQTTLSEAGKAFLYILSLTHDLARTERALLDAGADQILRPVPAPGLTVTVEG